MSFISYLHVKDAQPSAHSYAHAKPISVHYLL